MNDRYRTFSRYTPIIEGVVWIAEVNRGDIAIHFDRDWTRHYHACHIEDALTQYPPEDVKSEKDLFDRIFTGSDEEAAELISKYFLLRLQSFGEIVGKCESTGINLADCCLYPENFVLLDLSDW